MAAMDKASEAEIDARIAQLLDGLTKVLSIREQAAIAIKKLPEERCAQAVVFAALYREVRRHFPPEDQKRFEETGAKLLEQVDKFRARKADA
jgi:hypothetical protein